MASTTRQQEGRGRGRRTRRRRGGEYEYEYDDAAATTTAPPATTTHRGLSSQRGEEAFPVKKLVRPLRRSKEQRTRTRRTSSTSSPAATTATAAATAAVLMKTMLLLSILLAMTSTGTMVRTATTAFTALEKDHGRRGSHTCRRRRRRAGVAPAFLLPPFANHHGRGGGGVKIVAPRTTTATTTASRLGSHRSEADEEGRTTGRSGSDGIGTGRQRRSLTQGFPASAFVGRLFSARRGGNGTSSDPGPSGGDEDKRGRNRDEVTFSDGGDDDDDVVNVAVDESEGFYDEDFESWALGLGQWPLIPDPPPPSSSRRGAASAQGARKGYADIPNDDDVGNPLASLVDLEALWRALQQLSPPLSQPEATATPELDGTPTPTVAAQLTTNAESLSNGTDSSASSTEGSILDGLYGILSIERILRAGNLFQVFESDRSGAPQPSQPPKVSATVVRTTKAKANATSSSSTGKNATLFQQATSQLESFVGDASAMFASPSIVMDFIGQAAQVLQETTKNTTQTLLAIRELQKRQEEEERARAAGATEDQGAGVPREDEAERRVRAALAFSANLVAVADAVLRQGYVAKRPYDKTTLDVAAGVAPRPPAVAGAAPSRALFADFATVREIQAFSSWLAKGAEMGALSGAIYEQTVPRTHALNHTIVATGVTADVAWMVTDSLGTDAAFASTSNTGSPTTNGTATVKGANATAKATATPPTPFLVRTITLRGFDASDENVDREELLMRVCTANPETFKTRKGSVVQFHSGLWGMARALYRDLKSHVSWTAPSHKIVLAGHSVGGSLAVLLLLLMTMDMGPEFVASKVLRVYTYGSPPVARRRFVTDEDRQRNALRPQESSSSCRCDVLEAFDLPASLVEGYVQPWDPIVRLFSEIDPLYPLLGDVGADGVTPWASGPPRTLRPITKAIMEAWEGWPRFRDTLASTGNQTYRSVGVQHVLIPEPTRYLADRFVGVNVQVPPVTTLLRISSNELLPALQLVFPLDVFEISFVPQAIRSFVHHFYPAYGFPLVDYAKRLEAPPVSSKPSSPKETPVNEHANGDAPVLSLEDDLRRTSAEQTDLMSDLGRAAQWLRGRDPP